MRSTPRGGRSPSGPSRRSAPGWWRGRRAGSTRGLDEPPCRRLRIAVPEDGGAGDEHLRACLDQRADVAEIHAAVHLDLRLEPAVLDDAAQAADLVQGPLDELLSTEPRVHGHHEDVIELGQDLVQG